MKQTISPAVIVAAVVIVLALVGFFGYRTLARSKPTGMTIKPTDYADRMNKMRDAQSANMQNGRSRMFGGMHPAESSPSQGGNAGGAGGQ